MSTLMNALGARQTQRFQLSFPPPPPPPLHQVFPRAPPVLNGQNFSPSASQLTTHGNASSSLHQHQPHQFSGIAPFPTPSPASNIRHSPFINDALPPQPPASPHIPPANATPPQGYEAPHATHVSPPMVLNIPNGPAYIPPPTNSATHAPPRKPDAFQASASSLEDDIPKDREPISHASRHPFRPVIPPRHREKKQVREGDRRLMKDNAKNSQRAEQEARLDQIGMEFQDILEGAAEELKMSVEEVRRRVFKRVVDRRPMRKVNLWNAKLHRKAEELRLSNKLDGLSRGEKMKAIREAVKEDPDLCDLDAEDSDGADLIQELEDTRELQSTGLRANNKAAAKDFGATVKRLSMESRGLNLRTGARSIMFIAKGHPTDPGDVEYIVSGGAEEFCFEVLKYHIVDIAGLFEAWSCAKSVAPVARQTRETMAKEVGEILEHGLFVLTNVKSIRMVYSDIGSISEKYAVELVGWPDEEDCPFVRPTKLLCPQLRLLLRALKDRTCKWVRMSKESHTALCEDRLKNKKRKRRSDAGGTHQRRKGTADDDSDDDDDSNSDDDDGSEKEGTREGRAAEKENERPRKRARTKPSVPKQKRATKAMKSKPSRAKKAAPKSSAVVDSDLDDDL